MKKKVIIYLYNRLMDPLIQGNIFQYINSLTKVPSECPYQFVVVTYEDDTIPVHKEQLQSIKEDLSRRNIEWKPIKWHPGTSPTKKLKDLFMGLKILLRLRMKGYKYIVSLASVAGSFAYIAAALYGMKLYLYQYEPHSEYAVDNKMWSAGSINFRLLNFLERKSACFATVISSGTRHMMERLRQWKVKAAFYKIPSVANDSIFVFKPDLRQLLRKKYGIDESRKVIVYPGKFGDLYYGIELFYVFKWLADSIDNVFFLIVTPNDEKEIVNWINEVGLEPNMYTIGKATYHEMPGILSVADFGIINVPPGPSKKFISNIKVGEYLCCGVPYLICKGISEDDWYAENKHVGVVVDRFSESCIRQATPAICKLLSANKKIMVERCRTIGVEYRGLSTMQSKFEQALQALTS